MEIFKLFGRILVDNSQANEELDDTEKKAKDAADAFTEMATQAAEMAGSVASAAGELVKSIGVKAVQATDEFYKSLSMLQKQTGVTDGQMANLRKSVENIYNKNLGEDFNDIAESISSIARTTGLTGEELEKTTTNALKLKKTFGYDVAESANTVNSLMKDFGISAEEAYTLVAQGAQQGADKNGNMLSTLSEFSVQFKSLGYDAEGFTDVLIQGARSGVFDVASLADGLKEFNNIAKEGADTTLQAFEDLGFNAAETTKAFASGGEAASTASLEVIKALSEIDDPVKKNSIGLTLFAGKWQDLQGKAIEALGNIESKTNQSADTLAKMDTTKFDSPMKALEGLGRQLETKFFIPLGEKIMPKINEFVALIEKNAPEIEKTLGGAVDALGGFFDGLAESIKWVIDNMNWILPIIQAVTFAIAAQMIIDGLQKAYKAWTAATATQTTAQWLLTSAMNASPFGVVALAIGLVIAAVILVIKYWDEIVAAAIATWGWLQNFFKTKIGMIVALMGGPITMVMAIIANWDLIKQKASAIWGAIVYKIQTFVLKFRMAFHKLRNNISKIMQNIRERIQNVVEKIRERFNTFKEKLQIVKDAFAAFKAKIVEIFENVKTSISEKVDKIKGFFQSIKDTITNIFTSLWGIIKRPLNLVIGGLNLFIDGFEKIVNKAADLINKIPALKIPSWIPWLGGKTFDLPDFPKLDIPDIPKLAKGGLVMRGGSALVGEAGPELLSLPRGAQVTPLDKAGQSIVININDAKVFDTRDGERLGELIVKSLKLKGIIPRGV